MKFFFVILNLSGGILNITQQNILWIIRPRYGLIERAIVGDICLVLKIRENEATLNIKGPFFGGIKLCVFYYLLFFTLNLAFKKKKKKNKKLA